TCTIGFMVVGPEVAPELIDEPGDASRSNPA
ncbi:MAG: hypothetical protein JWM31_516, partial [Solirubrobacterales bacterium]|nr:hypothetical protein [Solirubrobacterales bacterium]